MLSPSRISSFTLESSSFSVSLSSSGSSVRRKNSARLAVVFTSVNVSSHSSPGISTGKFRKKLSGAKIRFRAAPSYETVRKLCCETSETVLSASWTHCSISSSSPHGASAVKSGVTFAACTASAWISTDSTCPSASLVHADGMVIVRKKSTDSCFPSTLG